MATFEIEDFQQ